MQRTRFSVLRFSLLLALVGVFLYSASVQEIHYLFVNHHTEVSEHCHNHLHTQTGHVDCNLCKIELDSYVRATHHYDATAQLFNPDKRVYNTNDLKLSSQQYSQSLRGPPALV